ncbi:MAG: FHA domain-containing protein [Myxococcales bacterium]|nr:FHA domain-containing protein [Myxococcales bacterium]
MQKLKIIDSSGREREVEITTQPKVFGRGEDSDVVLGSRSVSRHHVKMWDEAGKVMVEDLTNGQATKLAGELVSGSFELPPGVPMEVGAFIFQLPAPEPVATEQAPTEQAPVPLLVGTRGPTKDIEIELDEGDNSIGRDPNSTVAIEDPSISRMHARLQIQAGRFTLIDMRSSNGTFVNNKRIEQVDLVSGDVLRFGNLEFRFLYGEPVRPSGMPRRKKLMLIGGGVLALFLIIGIAAKSCGAPPPKASDGGPVEPQVPDEVLAEQALMQARSFISELNWDEAEKAVETALNHYPISPEGKKLQKKIKAERANKILFEDATTNYEVGRLEEALEQFRRVPKDSIYYQKCKYKIGELEKRLGDYHLKEGISYFKANNFKAAHRHLTKYMELSDETRCDQKTYQNWVKRTEANLRVERQAFTPYVVRCDKPDVQPVAPTATPEELLRAAFPERELYDIMLLYYKGKADTALLSLRKLIALTNNGKLLERAKDIELSMKIVNGKFKEGTASLQAGDIKTAREQFRVALENDQKLMGAELRSYYREDVGRQLSLRLYKEGLEIFNRAVDNGDAKMLEKAFVSWSDCLKLKPDDTDCLSGMQLLENAAEQLLQAATAFEQRDDPRAIERWRQVVAITRPESLPYKNAKLKLREYNAE